MRLRPGSTHAADAPKGRAARSNAASRYDALRVEGIDDGWGADEDEPGLAREVREEEARSMVTRNDSPDVGFDRSLNPYRGCEHGCIYCFARPTHAYLGLSPGLDFETRLSAKANAAEALRRDLSKPGYEPRSIAIGTSTDPYQPLERERRLMPGILDVLIEARHPFSITTKGGGVAADIDRLGEAARLGIVHVAVSVTTLDHRLARAMEPRATTPARRLKAVEALAGAGVPVMVMAAPMIPGLTDHELEAILTAGRDAGAGAAGTIPLRMPHEIKALFREWLEATAPDRAARVLRGIREMHGGRDYDPEWGTRMTGTGVRAKLLAARFDAAIRRLGLSRRLAPQRRDLFRPPGDARQGWLL